MLSLGRSDRDQNGLADSREAASCELIFMSMPRTNEFAFKIATANGTGSASANGLIMQAIFRMGIPVTGKNVFPSNIQGLPTWYEIRVDKHGYTARTPHFDLMAALNPATYQKDIQEVRSGGWLLYDSTWPLDPRLTRPDVTYLGHSPRRDVQRAVRRPARAHPDEEHRLCRRAGGAPRHGHRDHPDAAHREVLAQAVADGLEPAGGRSRLQLRARSFCLSAADPARGDGQDEGLDPHRRQHRGGARLRLRRRDGRRLVPDYAGDVADGSLHHLLPEVPP